MSFQRIREDLCAFAMAEDLPKLFHRVSGLPRFHVRIYSQC